MLRKCLLVAVIAITGCTTVTKYEAEIYKDGFITQNGKSVYVLKQRVQHESSYFYAVFDNYSETDSFISAQLLKLGLDGKVEKTIELGTKINRIVTWNDSVTILNDTTGSPLKVNVESGIVSRLQYAEGYDKIIGTSASTYYTLDPSGGSVTIFKRSFDNDKTDQIFTSIRLSSPYDSTGYISTLSVTGFNHLVGKNTLCYYTKDNLYLCNMDNISPANIQGYLKVQPDVVSISGYTKVMPLSPTLFIGYTTSTTGLYSFNGSTPVLVSNIYTTKNQHIVADSSGNNAIRVDYDEYDISKLSGIVLVNLRSGVEKQLCIESRDTLKD